MAPVNGIGAAGPVKTAPRPSSSIRPASTIIPALPLNFPQRPTAKRPSIAADPAPSPKAPNGTPSPQEKLAARPAGPGQELRNGAGSALNKSPNNNNNNNSSSSSSSSHSASASASVSSPSGASTQAATNTPAGSSEATTEEREKDTPTVSSIAPDRRPSVTMPRRRPSAQPDASFGPMGAAPGPGPGPGPGPEGLAPAAGHPALVHRPAYHQAHPSNGSMVFGGFHDSNASSPAPRSGGLFPPPGLLPYPRPPVDLFQGSQSSLQADDHAFPPYHAVNGHGAPPAGPIPPPPMNGTVLRGPVVPPSPMYQDLHDQEDALSFLRHGITDTTFNDCMLEVCFVDSTEFQDHPGYQQLHKVLRAPAHRFILSRSPTLLGIMKSQGTAPGGVVFLDVKDEYMRSDVFWYSLRALYGWSFADGFLHTELQLRDARDDMKTALSYVATARYLQLPWVYPVAVHRVARLLHWNTIDLAVKFVSQIAAMSPRHDGSSIPELAEHVLAFLVHNFPVDFVLDADAGDCYGFPRLPAAAPPAPKKENGAPGIANGTSNGTHSRQASKTQAQLPRNPRLSSNHRLSQIKFGDLSPSKDGASTPRSPTSADKVLSGILLNLPFELLKRVLEHPSLGKLSGELTPASRQSIITGVVAEREARRLRVLENKGDARLRAYQERVENASAPVLVVTQVDDYWVNNLGFKEEVFPGDAPFLVHTWSMGPPSSASS
ncbi:hypothetical protein VTJ83DRAFT_5321 [Remersonia thermophila]|uniref:F-box domain-containing protein n=1 Tax=Remersonia thermophila TaxID=72144 RepID=A0ABR4D7F9_9PEZI